MAHGVQLVAIKGDVKETAAGSAGKKKDTVQSSGDDKKSLFADILGKTGRLLSSADKKTGSTDSMKLSALVDRLLKNLKQDISPETRNKLLAFLKQVSNSQTLSEKDKAGIFSGLLKKLKDKNDISSSLLDSLSAFLASMEKDVAGTAGKKNLKNMMKLIDSVLDDAPVKNSRQGAGGTEPKLVIIDTRKLRNEKDVKELKNREVEPDAALRKNQLKAGGSDNSSDQFISVLRKSEGSTVLLSENNAARNAAQTGLGREMMQKLEKAVQDEMVRQTKLIIRDGGRGEIKIVLKPESLGHVRLKVNLDNNHIDGRIFVENNNIKQMFEQAIEHLNTTLRQEGYDFVSLHVSVGNGNQQNSRDKSPENAPEKHMYIDSASAADAAANAAAVFEKNLISLFDAAPDFSNVNLVI